MAFKPLHLKDTKVKIRTYKVIEIDKETFSEAYYKRLAGTFVSPYVIKKNYFKLIQSKHEQYLRFVGSLVYGMDSDSGIIIEDSKDGLLWLPQESVFECTFAEETAKTIQEVLK